MSMHLIFYDSFHTFERWPPQCPLLTVAGPGYFVGGRLYPGSRFIPHHLPFVLYTSLLYDEHY
jgi:hypothetical protein